MFRLGGISEVPARPIRVWQEFFTVMRNAMILYPYIKELVISYGKAAEILEIRKYELIDLYDKLGLPYLDQDIREVEEEVQYWKKLKGAVL